MNILGVDIGGTNLKFRTQQQDEIVKVPSGPKMTPEVMMKAIKAHTVGWKYDRVSVGFPGPVIHDKPLLEPHNLGKGWVRFDVRELLRFKDLLFQLAAFLAEPLVDIGTKRKQRLDVHAS